jgi:hypothetical protein
MPFGQVPSAPAASETDPLALLKASNLSDLANSATARSNLGLGTAAVAALASLLQAANNLSDLANAGTARTNLGLGTAATLASSAVAQTANNLSDLANAGTARTNLGLGTASTLASSAVAQTANNLSDLANAATARANLGLGNQNLRPTGALAETFPRVGASLTSQSTSLVSGRANMVGIGLPAGLLVSSITIVWGSTAPSGLTNLWYFLADSSRNKLGVTSDNGSSSPASTALTLNLASPFTTTYAGLHYIGLVVVASTTLPVPIGVGSATQVNGVAPIISGSSTTGLTDPASCPTTLGALSAISPYYYAYVS